MIPELRRQFNSGFSAEKYASLLRLAQECCETKVDYRIAETPVFLPQSMLAEMADAGAEMTHRLLADPDYLDAARKAIPEGFDVAGQTAHPNFLTADFALVQGSNGALSPRLVEIQAFPSIYAFQAALSAAYKDAFGLGKDLRTFLNGLDEAGYWDLFSQTVLGGHDPQNVVLTEIDPRNQKTLPDFLVTAQRLGIAIVDIRSLEPIADKLHYRDPNGRLVPVHRIYNRAIADELMARSIKLPFELTRPWDVEWAGHPNWYFLISKFSIPWLSRPPMPHPMVPPAVFLDAFLDGGGKDQLASQGVSLPADSGPATVYRELLLKPLFSFAGKGIHFDPTRELLESIPAESRKEYLLQQRMRFEHTIETPHGLTQAEIRILYLWPDGGKLTPALSLVRLGRGKMMGVDHNKNQEWVGASAAFFPQD